MTPFTIPNGCSATKAKLEDGSLVWLFTNAHDQKFVIREVSRREWWAWVDFKAMRAGVNRLAHHHRGKLSFFMDLLSTSGAPMPGTKHKEPA